MFFRRKPQRAWLLACKQRLFSNTVKKLFLSWAFNDPDCTCVDGGRKKGKGEKKKVPREALRLMHWLINQLILGYAQALSSPKCGKSRALCVSREHSELEGAGQASGIAFPFLPKAHP